MVYLSKAKFGSLALLLLLCVGTTTAANLKPFQYRYDVTWGGIGVGKLALTLESWTGHAGCFRYATTTQPSALVKMFYGAPSQTSLFCVRNGHIQSQRFVSTLPGNKTQSYTLAFDWATHTVVDGHGRTRHIPEDAVDSLALQQAVRLWVLTHSRAEAGDLAHFTMVDEKHITHYILRLGGQLTVNTPAGQFDTVLISRIGNRDKRDQFWLAPALGYMPVKTSVRDGSRPAVTMELAEKPHS